PAYMSPEQCSSGEVTGASDQYSLGAVAYYMITGKPPFAGPTAVVLQRQVTETPPPIAALRPDCPRDLLALVDRMLKKDPADRFPTVGDAIEEMGPTHLSRNHALRSRMAEIAASVAEVKLEAHSSSLHTGQELQLSAVPYDGTGRPLPTRQTYWLSSDPSIALIEEGRLKAVGVGHVTVTARCERAQDSLQIQIVPVPLGSIEVTPAPGPLHPGDVVAFRATPRSPSGAPLGDRTVEWSSDDASVVVVSPGGTVEARSPGSVTLWARCEDQAVPVELVITPRPVSDIVVEGARAWVISGEAFDLGATVRAADGSILADRPVRWRSADPEVLRVDEGRVTAVQPGHTTIEVASGDFSKALPVEVRPVPVDRVELSKTPSVLVQGEGWVMSARPLAADGSHLGERVIQWTSTNPDVAAVDEHGSIVAVSPGRTTITAACGGAADSFVIQVEQIPVAQLELRAPQSILEVGETMSLMVTARSTTGDRLDDRTMIWSSGSPDVARVGGSGIVEGLKAGVATITATCGRAAKSLVIQVFPVPVRRIEMVVPQTELQLGDRVGLSASPLSADGKKLTDRSLVWRSSNHAVATVDEEGFVEAVGRGAATITAVCEGVEASARLAVKDPSRAATQVFTAPVAASGRATRDLARAGQSRVSGRSAKVDESAGRRKEQAEATSVAGRRLWGVPLAVVGVVATAVVVVTMLQPRSDLAPGPREGADESGVGVVDSVAEAVDTAALLAGAAGALDEAIAQEEQRADTSGDLGTPAGAQPTEGRATGAEGPQPAPVEAGGASVPEGIVDVVGVLPSGGVVVLSGSGLERRAVDDGQVSLPPGTYRFEISAPGYEARTHEVTVTAGGRHSVATDLVREAPREGTLRVGQGLPPNAVVTLSGNGVSARTLTGSTTLPPGIYSLETRAPGFEPTSSSITVVAGQERVYAPTLQRLPEPPEETGPTPEDVAGAVREVLETLGVAVESQDRAGATNAFPGATDWFERIAPVFSEEIARSVTVTVGTMALPTLQGSTATVNVDIQVMFRDIRNNQQNLPQELIGVFRQQGGSWILSSLVPR
ncbi:MAG: Ig-like domain-containing protein, partial [Gemmatimonadota bacterium]|nr:Ig-like domain-containing protein [Gemmatimonadota bacterium]